MGRPKLTIPLGSRFGKLEVIGPYGLLNGHSSVMCRCDCGNAKEITCSNLRNNQSKSCGCNRIREKYHNLVGNVFGRLTVIDDSLRSKTHRLMKCMCACGAETIQPLHAVVDGRVVSCGCYIKNLLLQKSLRHGHARRGKVTTEFRIWSDMIKRCSNPRHKHYASYGGRGITVCERWRKFENFLEDMGFRPNDLTLDRYPDVNGNYEPGNCRWATDHEQANNRRDTPMVEYQGRTQSIADWSRELGVKYWSLRNRLVNLGWSPEKAFTIPFERGRNQFS